MGGFERFTLPSGNKMLYCPTETFPPGKGTIQIADITAQDLNLFHSNLKDRSQPVNVLELGVGPGTFLVELASQLFVPSQFKFDGIDFDPLSVKLTKHNLKKIGIWRHIKINVEINNADWNHSETWNNFKNIYYHLIYFNPPYLHWEAEIPEKLGDTPQDMVRADGHGGLYHYRSVLKRLPSILSKQSGSSIVFRIPEYLDNKDLASNEEGSLGRVLWKDVIPQIPNAKVIYNNLAPYAKGHFCKIII